MQILYNPLFRNVVLFLAIVVLMVFCIDKSRQNKRTRNALYNCVYVLFAGAVLKLIQIVDLLLPFGFLERQMMGLAVMVMAVIGYWRFLKPQDDIPFNKVFYWLGWIVLGVSVALQVAFFVMALMSGEDIQA
ncbi:MAG: hypothetical protein IJK08_11555 [Prevotella sp.]|jgi:hypothetical protein|nr:hypothetical protein [Prevotella sp.]